MANRKRDTKPSPAQMDALVWLVEEKNGRAGWSIWDGDALECFRERTWHACTRKGWVTIDKPNMRVLVTEAGRAVAAPAIRGREEGRREIAEIKAEAAAKTAAWMVARND